MEPPFLSLAWRDRAAFVATIALLRNDSNEAAPVWWVVVLRLVSMVVCSCPMCLVSVVVVVVSSFVFA